MDLFRAKGFDGASVSDISDATGLGKSSLYHHFPDGKEEMAIQVLAHLEGFQLERALFEPMRSSGTPKQKLDRMLDTIDRFYDGGRKACLLERLGGERRRHALSHGPSAARSRHGLMPSRRSASRPDSRVRSRGSVQKISSS